MQCCIGHIVFAEGYVGSTDNPVLLVHFLQQRGAHWLVGTQVLLVGEEPPVGVDTLDDIVPLLMLVGIFGDLEVGREVGKLPIGAMIEVAPCERASVPSDDCILAPLVRLVLDADSLLEPPAILGGHFQPLEKQVRLHVQEVGCRRFYVGRTLMVLP